MKKIIFLWGFLAIVAAGCGPAAKEDAHDSELEAVKIQLTAYSNEFELFAEADPFVAGRPSNVLTHFTFLSGFKALEAGSVKLRLVSGASEVMKTLDKPTRKGIYSFEIIPKTVGTGRLVFDIATGQKTYQVVVEGITVYSTKEEADRAAKASVVPRTNTVVFTKEQSWKIEFATEFPIVQPFGQVIRTSARVGPAPGDEVITPAMTDGLVLFTKFSVIEGMSVKAGQVLFGVSGSGLADNNASVRFREAENNYLEMKADYERKSELVKERIVSEADFLKSRNKYENARALYENLTRNFNSTGQSVTAPMDGFITQVFVTNGQYVETGHPLFSISRNRTMLLRADVRQKFAPLLQTITSANIRTLHDNSTYTLEELNGRILSFGRSAGSDNYLIPVNLQVENNGSFAAGSFVELFLKTTSNMTAVTVPNSTIMEEQGSYFVFRQINPELFEKRAVKPGATDGLRTEIVEGISDSDRVVSIGAIMIKLAQSSGALDAHAGHVH